MDKDKSLLNGKGEDDISWITTDTGAHVPIKDGQTKAAAIEEHFEEKHIDEEQSFGEQVDKILDGTYKDSHITVLKEPPKILQEIGIPNKPLLMTAKHVYLAINTEGKYTKEKDHYHGLGKDLFECIPKLLQSPVMVLKNNRAKNEIIAVLNWHDSNKNMLIAPIKINGRGNQNFIEVEANIVKSTYGRTNFKKFINDNFTQDDILAVQNKKIHDFNLED